MLSSRSKIVSLSSGGNDSQSSWYELLFEKEPLRDSLPGEAGGEPNSSLSVKSSGGKGTSISSSPGVEANGSADIVGSDFLLELVFSIKNCC